jgi:protein-S-isoprenylcysteine O-methyltransferase Ste14
MNTADQQSSESVPVLEPAPFFSKFPPPFLYIAVYVLALAVRHWLPLDIVPESLVPAAEIIGGFLAAVGVLLALASVALFFHRKTTVKPHGEPVHLVDVGPFIISRNPMYLSLTLIYTGAAFWQATIWPLILLPIPLLIMNTIVIPFEERRLHTLFGDSFDEYRRRVRRWI